MNTKSEMQESKSKKAKSPAASGTPFEKGGIAPESTSNGEAVDLAKQADLNFQERLEDHSKQALIHLVTELTKQDQVNRGWMLKYLNRVDEILGANPPALPEQLTARHLLIIAQYEMYESVSLIDGKDVAEPYLALMAEDDRRFLDQYMNYKLQVLCGEMGNVSTLGNPPEDACNASLQTDNLPIKKADDAATSPADKSESLNNQ